MFPSLLAMILLTAFVGFALAPDANAALWPKKKFQADMEAGIAAFQGKDYKKAEQFFRACLDQRLTVPEVGKTRFNLGLTLKVQKKYDEAVTVFESILNSGVDDREPGENLMEEFMNYRYRSCLQIAACYEAQDKPQLALKYVMLARDKYKYEAHCGTCAAQAKEGLDAELKSVQAKVRKK